MSAPRPLLFGEVLFDRFPDGTEVLGGAPFNVAWNLQGLGLAPLFVSRVGDDPAGERVLAQMRAFDMDTSGVQVDPERPTGAVEVRVEGGEPSYEILPDQAYDAIDAGALPEAGGELLLCHGTLALRSAPPRAALRRLAPRAAKRVVDVNLRAPWWDRDEVLAVARGAHLLKLNTDELAELAGPGDEAGAARDLARALGVSRVVVTRGARGALALEGDAPPVEAAPPLVRDPVDTVGAGDAFTSVLVAAECLGWPFPTALDRALELAAAVVGLRGATCERPEFYEPLLERWDLT